QLVHLHDFALVWLRGWWLLLLSLAYPVDHRLMIDAQQPSDASEAVLFQIQPNGLFSQSNRIGIGPSILCVAMTAVSAEIALPTIRRFAISNLPMLAAARRTLD